MNKKESQSGLTMLEVIIASVILSVVVEMASYLVWNSSTTVSESELGVQLDSQARAIVTQIANDVRQCKSAYIRAYDPISGNATLPAANIGYSGIQMRLPGAGFDSSSLNASQTSANKGAWLQAYSANNDAYLTRMVRYYWVVDAGSGETLVNGQDDNKDGRVDEGILQKFDSLTDSSGTPILVQGTTATAFHSNICRDLRNCNTAIIAPIPSPYTPATTPANQISPCNWGVQFVVDAFPNPTKMTITLTLEKIDPKKKTYAQNHTIVKQVQTTVDLRN